MILSTTQGLPQPVTFFRFKYIPFLSGFQLVSGRFLLPVQSSINPSFFSGCTPRKTKLETKNWRCVDVFPFPRGYFQGVYSQQFHSTQPMCLGCISTKENHSSPRDGDVANRNDTQKDDMDHPIDGLLSWEQYPQNLTQVCRSCGEDGFDRPLSR